MICQYWLIFVLLLIPTGIASGEPKEIRADSATKLPEVRREFRAAWVATVANIDWPSKPGLTVSEQQEELHAILDRAVQLNLNAIIFQVRPHCDALYDSKLEPWSEYLTGTMGQPPQPAYDPLAMFVKEAHARGLELHAWFNPYRASHPSGHSELATTHISKTKPHVVRKYGKYLWLDPGEPEAVRHSLDVIVDVVRRYDIDGVHFDDYFYPYPIKDEQGKQIPFPDDRSWEQSLADGETLDRDDWRRKNVDQFIRQVYQATKKEKPWVKFGVSPFGIWKPGHPESIQGFNAYASLYADARKWLDEGWVDYFTPQLYWQIESSGQSYPVLLKWWHEQNRQQRHLWPGNYASQVANAELKNWPVEELTQQIKITRDQPGATGNVHFSMKSLMDDRRGVAEALANGPYQEPALVPASNWLGNQLPDKAEVTSRKSQGGLKIQMDLPGDNDPWLWVIRTKTNGRWQTEIVPGHVRTYDLSAAIPSPSLVAVSAVNRLGLEGPVTTINPEEQQ